MIYIIAILLALLLATWFGKPPQQIADLAPAGTQWKCVLTNRKVFIVTAATEADAVKQLMLQHVDVGRIATLERMP